METLLNINFSDAKVSIHTDQRNRDNEAFLKQVMLSACAMMRKKGWEIRVPYGEDFRPDFSNNKMNRQWDEKIRKGNKKGLEFCADISGKYLEFEFWEDVNDHKSDNANGGRYIFHKESKMPHLLKMITLLTKNQILEHLKKHYRVNVDKKIKPLFSGRKTAYEKVCNAIKESSHYKKELGHAEIHCNNDISADKLRIKHGSEVYAIDYKGRVIKGIAYYNLNSNWYIVTGKWDYTVKSTYEIYVKSPGKLKEKRNKRRARRLLESKMALAIKDLDFKKAQLYKELLFGNEPLFHVMKGDLYYKSGGCGYTSNPIDAGKYTQKESEKYRNDSQLNVIPIYQC